MKFAEIRHLKEFTEYYRSRGFDDAPHALMDLRDYIELLDAPDGNHILPAFLHAQPANADEVIFGYHYTGNRRMVFFGLDPDIEDAGAALGDYLLDHFTTIVPLVIAAQLLILRGEVEELKEVGK